MPKTNVNHWRNVAQKLPPDDWLLRSELASYFIRPNDIVCDLGAGAQAIRSLLPSTTRYIPVDCVQEHEGTFFADFNQDFSLPEEPFSVILCSGCSGTSTICPAFSIGWQRPRRANSSSSRTASTQTTGPTR